MKFASFWKWNYDRLDDCVDEIKNEYYQAKKKHKPFHNLHEAYAILKEEFDEFWAVVKLNQDRNPDRTEKALKEARQIAAMALGVLYEFGDW